MARGHRLPVLLAALLAALALAVFWPATDHAFIEEFDDSQYVTRNPWMRVPFGLDSVRWAFTSIGVRGELAPADLALAPAGRAALRPRPGAATTW